MKIHRNEYMEVHRVNGPAVEYINGDYSWYINEEIHRYYGPARRFNGINGRHFYYIFGEMVT